MITKPTPTANHVWEHNRGSFGIKRYVVSRTDSESAYMNMVSPSTGFYTDVSLKHMVESDIWQCIGIQLPNGELMLAGETWEYCWANRHDKGVVRHELRDVFADSVSPFGYFREVNRSLTFIGLMGNSANHWHKVTKADVSNEEAIDKPCVSCGKPCQSGWAIGGWFACSVDCFNSYSTAHSQKPLTAMAKEKTPAERIDPRRVIEQLLAQDAASYPRFAKARFHAVMTIMEHASDGTPNPGTAKFVLDRCHEYEELRQRGFRHERAVWEMYPGPLQRRDMVAPEYIEAYNRGKSQ